jgi:purine-cytosine permease-like protein
MNVRPDWSSAYYDKGIGALLLSIYSGALALQQLAKPLQAMPRFIWSIVLFACMLGLSLGGRDHIYEFLSNMLSF